MVHALSEHRMLTEADLNKIGLEVVHVINDNVSPRLDAIELRLDRVESRLDGVESQMVTKSYLDDKMADQRGELINMLHKEDDRMSLLVNVLEEEKSLSSKKAQSMRSLRVFKGARNS